MLKKVCMTVVIMLLFIVLTGYWGNSVICAAEKQEAPNSKSEETKAPERAVDPHVGYFRFYF